MNNNITWHNLFTKGSIVKETIRNPNLQIQKKKEDFGLSDDYYSEKSGTTGHWKIIDKKHKNEIDEIERKIRKVIDVYSLPFPLVKSGKFVPNESMEELTRQLNNYKEEFKTATNKLLENYDKYWEEQKINIISEVDNLSSEEYNAYETIQRIDKTRPKVDKLREKFEVIWNIFAFSAPVSESVAAMVEDEGESVKNAIKDMMSELVYPLRKRIKELAGLIKKGGRSFSMKSINAALRDCDMYDNQNVFKDKDITDIVSRFRRLLNSMDPKAHDISKDKWTKELNTLEKECTTENSIDFLFSL